MAQPEVKGPHGSWGMGIHFLASATACPQYFKKKRRKKKNIDKKKKNTFETLLIDTLVLAERKRITFHHNFTLIAEVFEPNEKKPRWQQQPSRSLRLSKTHSTAELVMKSQELANLKIFTTSWITLCLKDLNPWETHVFHGLRTSRWPCFKRKDSAKVDRPPN